MASLMAAPAMAQTAWDMPTPYGDGIFHTQNIMQFADDLREKTDGSLDYHRAFGKIRCSVMPRSRTRSATALVPIGEILLSRLANEAPIFALDSHSFPGRRPTRKPRRCGETSREGGFRSTGRTGPDRSLTPLPLAGPEPLSETRKSTDPAQMEGLAFPRLQRRHRAAGRASRRNADAGRGNRDIPTAFSTGRVEAMITSPSTARQRAGLGLHHPLHRHAGLAAQEHRLRETPRLSKRFRMKSAPALMEAAEEAEARGWEMSRAETRREDRGRLKKAAWRSWSLPRPCQPSCRKWARP